MRQAPALTRGKYVPSPTQTWFGAVYRGKRTEQPVLGHDSRQVGRRDAWAVRTGAHLATSADTQGIASDGVAFGT